MKVLITTIPFGAYDDSPLQLLKDANIEYFINPYNRKITEHELTNLIQDFDVLIAGTEPISEHVLHQAKNLRLIARVGVGFSNINLSIAEKKDIKITYTPNGPDSAVADLTIGFIYSLLRSIHLSNLKLHQGIWERYMGKNLVESKIGIIGVGRIGFKVAREIHKLEPKSIMLNDINQNRDLKAYNLMGWYSMDSILKDADVISIHLPFTEKTMNLIGLRELRKMKTDAVLINTSRGGIVNEKDLFDVMQEGHLSGAALDVFEEEPYNGPLTGIDRCLLTAHTGTMTQYCRAEMEHQAVTEVINFSKGLPLGSEIPNYP